MTRDKISIMILVTPIFLVMLACNPVSEDVTEQTWSSLHNAKPFQSEYFHSADYRFPIGACDEVQCHGNDLTGGNSGAPSCTSCHDSTQWTIFTTTHTVKISGYYHSLHVNDVLSSADRNTNAGWFSTCAAVSCHGTTFDGNQPVPAENAQYRYSCKGCHTGFTGSIPPPLHTRKREGAWHSSGSCTGAACHGTGSGEDYTGGSAATAISGIAGHGPACDQCHD